MAKHGKNMPEPFTGAGNQYGIEKHGITKYKQTPEPYFGPYEIIGGGNQWGEDECMDAGGGDRFSRSVNAFHGGTGLWGVMVWPIG